MRGVTYYLHVPLLFLVPIYLSLCKRWLSLLFRIAFDEYCVFALIKLFTCVLNESPVDYVPIFQSTSALVAFGLEI